MGLIELFIVACTLNGECRNYRVPMPEDVGIHQCMMSSMMTLSKWAAEHPGWTPKRWRCEKPSQDT